MVLKPEGQKYKKKTIKTENLATINTGVKFRNSSESEITANPIYHLHHSGTKLTRLLKLGETRNLLGLVHILFLNYCVPLLSGECVTNQDPYSLGQRP